MMEFGPLTILLLSFLVPCIALMGAIAGIHLGTMIFGPITISLNRIINEATK
jgi:hypothetical protein